jgi:glycerophosphoryl diester phosphodiesterase
MKGFYIPRNVNVKPPELVAHRGYALRYPENTMLSLRAAIEAGAKYIEFDVQLTADGVPVLLHDADLWRTGGVDRSVLDMKLEDVMLVEVNETARLGSRFSGVNVPLLGEIPALLTDHADVRAFVEIKRASLNRFGIDEVVQRVLAELTPVLSRCTIISFDRPAIEAARSRGAMTIGWVLEEWNDKVRAEVEELSPDYVFCDYRMVPDDEGLWSGSWSWAFYEVIDPELALGLAANGAQLVETMAIKEMLSDRRMITGRIRD